MNCLRFFDLVSVFFVFEGRDKQISFWRPLEQTPRSKWNEDKPTQKIWKVFTSKKTQNMHLQKCRNPIRWQVLNCTWLGGNILLIFLLWGLLNLFLLRILLDSIILFLLKGQLISKCLFGIFNFSKKQAKRFDLTFQVDCYGTSSQIVFAFFLEDLKTPKRHFEIN